MTIATIEELKAAQKHLCELLGFEPNEVQRISLDANGPVEVLLIDKGHRHKKLLQSFDWRLEYRTTKYRPEGTFHPRGSESQ